MRVSGGARSAAAAAAGDASARRRQQRRGLGHKTYRGSEYKANAKPSRRRSLEPTQPLGKSCLLKRVRLRGVKPAGLAPRYVPCGCARSHGPRGVSLTQSPGARLDLNLKGIDYFSLSDIPARLVSYLRTSLEVQTTWCWRRTCLSSAARSLRGAKKQRCSTAPLPRRRRRGARAPPPPTRRRGRPVGASA